MTRRMRVLVAGLFAGLLFVGTVAPVLAHVCINANKPDGAGNIGDVVINGLTGEVSLPTNPGGQEAGGFADVYLDFNGDGVGDILLVDDTFVARVLPEGAHNAAGCGKGVDSAEVCGP